MAIKVEVVLNSDGDIQIVTVEGDNENEVIKATFALQKELFKE